jgi:DNA replication and repair protein RecF
MGLFHVEQTYLEILNTYSRYLRQRNAALRDGDPKGVLAWSEGYCASAEALNQFRYSYLAQLMKKAQAVLADWKVPFSTQWTYRRGWPEEKSIREYLTEKLEVDLAQGFSGIGPHRADLVLTTSGAPVEKTLSRGQQKILVFALNLALMDILAERLRSKPILLVDDLPAELDASNQMKIATALRERGIQCFIASISIPDWFDPECDSMFHVEHGAATRKT